MDNVRVLTGITLSPKHEIFDMNTCENQQCLVKSITEPPTHPPAPFTGQGGGCSLVGVEFAGVEFA